MPSERILIAEDSPTQAEALKLILESEGYAAEVVGDGHAALEQARSGRFDLVLADVTMPGLDGYALCRAVRAEPTVAELPVVMLSALDEPSALSEGFRAGADGWVRKPVDVDELIEGLSSVLSRRAARRARRAGWAERLQRTLDALEDVRGTHGEALAELEGVLTELRALQD
jgi:DNA-binding response OmpR family regulator